MLSKLSEVTQRLDRRVVTGTHVSLTPRSMLLVTTFYCYRMFFKLLEVYTFKEMHNELFHLLFFNSL